MPRDSYYHGLLLRAWRETKAIFQWPRWWQMVAGTVTTIAIDLLRKGWREITNIGDMLLNGVGGAAIVFVGAFVINLFRAARLLDEDRQEETEGLDAKLNVAQAQIEQISEQYAENAAVAKSQYEKRIKALEEARRISPLERRKRDTVHERLTALQSPGDLAVLNCILEQGRMSVHEVRQIESVHKHFENVHAIQSALGRCCTSGLLNFETLAKPFDVTEYWIRPETQEALSFWLIERSGDLAPPSDRQDPTADTSQDSVRAPG